MNVLGLEDRLFGGALCVSGCNPLSGSPITVSGTATTNAIDFSLSIPVGLFANGFE
ncbi:MAG: hypothetical protein IPK97_02835 [Ahniella sp.]|nr:hypothetical protein [Ahniella sp.]